jgi:cbb3-type cytochrome oxidase subunit 3
MYTAWYQASEYLGYAKGAGIFFAVFFTAVIAWMLFDRSANFEAIARLPLEDDARPASPERTALATNKPSVSQR